MSRIEVAVTCYNYAHFLRQCVESVLTQSHRDCRILIIDDASTDDTHLVAAVLATEDERVAVLRHPVNLGHVATYNEAIGLAEGDYFLLLSADDFLLPGAIERALGVLDRQSDIGLVIGNCLRHEPPVRGVDLAQRRSPDAAILDPAAFIWGLVRDNWVATAAAITRTTVQKKLGGYLPALPHSGDLEMWLRFALRSRVAYLDVPQAVYRLHEKNMSLGYSGLDDFTQRNAAILMHLGAIRALPHHGKSLERRIRLRLLTLCILRAGLAVTRGQPGRARSLLARAMALACGTGSGSAIDTDPGH
ncbi:MAG TPA: glycosyltransferase family 2 protein [Dongiaceae bacterium]